LYHPLDTYVKNYAIKDDNHPLSELYNKIAHHSTFTLCIATTLSWNLVLYQASLFGVKDAGKFARLLASQAFFGDDVLRVSTVRGDVKRGLRALDSSTMGALITCIHQHPSFVHLTKLQFDDIVKKSVVPSIGHLCKELRNKR